MSLLFGGNGFGASRAAGERQASQRYRSRLRYKRQVFMVESGGKHHNDSFT